MPQYDYYCRDCKKSFVVKEHITEHGSHKVKCPKCKGTKIEQQYAAFAAVTSRKS